MDGFTSEQRDALAAKLGTLVDGLAPNPLSVNKEVGEPWEGKLVAYWRLSDPDDIQDLSGNGHDMTMIGTLTAFDSHPPVSPVESHQITVSADITQSLTFSIEGITDTDCENSVMDGAGNYVTTEPSSISFGTAFSNAFTTGCLELEVGTNAPDGYTLTIEKNQPLTSGSYTIDDGDCDGSCTTTTAAAWTSPSNNGFAYCMKDVTGTAAQTAGGWDTDAECGSATTPSFKLFPTSGTDDPQPVMEKASGTAGDISRTGYRLSIPPEQEPGTYTATVTYIAIPNF